MFFIAAYKLSSLGILLMVSAGISLSIFLAIPTAHWLSQRLANFLSFFSTEKFRKSPPLLSKSDALAMKGDVEGAYRLLRRFLKVHPLDLEVYNRLLDLTFGPMQDAELGDSIIAFGKKRLDKRGRRVIKERRNAIVQGELYPLKHLNWRPEMKNHHPEVEIPEALKGQFSPPSS